VVLIVIETNKQPTTKPVKIAWACI